MLENKLKNSDADKRQFRVICITYIAVLLAVIALRVFFWFVEIEAKLAEVIWNLTAQVLIMFLIPLIGLYFARKKKETEQITFAEFTQGIGKKERAFSYLGFKKPGGKVILWAIVLGFVMFFFNIFISAFFNGVLAGLGHRGAASSSEDVFFGISGLLISLLLTAVLPGVCEETAHRGLLLRGFRDRFGVTPALYLSALMFGLMHLNIVQCIFAMVLGYLMALAVLATRTIWTSVIIHFMNNALGVYLTFAADNGWFGGNLLTYFSEFIGVSIIIYLAVFVGLYFVIMWIIHRFARQNFIADHMTDEVPPRLRRDQGVRAVKYYLGAERRSKTEPLSAGEKSLLFGIIFLGVLITAMTLVWGFL